jgi:putative oxidoreductase
MWTSRLLSVLRIVAAFLFIAHGTQKLWGAPGGNPVEDLLSLRGIAGILEAFGGAFVLVGWLTRPVAFILSGEMAVAYFLRHEPRGFWPILNGGELAALYAFLFLYLAAAGGGPWSLDAWFARRRRAGRRAGR